MLASEGRLFLLLRAFARNEAKAEAGADEDEAVEAVVETEYPEDEVVEGKRRTG